MEFLKDQPSHLMLWIFLLNSHHLNGFPAFLSLLFISLSIFIGYLPCLEVVLPRDCFEVTLFQILDSSIEIRDLTKNWVVGTNYDRDKFELDVDEKARLQEEVGMRRRDWRKKSKRESKKG